ncbi:MAG TPA: hypothetical protein VNZ49_12875 [Bacteroidia bacterium]|jgi:hypothetical protein|nr:hypothetical protein [Bacteroidia bacterium]
MKKITKGLQKFTDFENIKTKEDFIKFKKENPDRMDILYEFITKRLNEVANASEKKEGELDKYFNRAIRFTEVNGNEEMGGIIKRERWYINESKINVFVNNYLAKNRFVPSTADIARDTGLSRVTIQKHLKERKDTEYYKEQKETLSGLTNSVLCQLYKIGIEDSNVKALKVFVDYFKEENSIAETKIGTQNNYIQINNTLLTEEMVKKFSPLQLKQIEEIISTKSII